MRDLKDEAGPYREGLEPLLRDYAARRGRLVERAHALDATARAELLPAHRLKLERLAAGLSPSPSTREALDAAEGALAAYEKEVDDALWVIAELRGKGALAAEGRRRRRRNAVLVVAGLGAFAAGLMGWTRWEDRLALERRRDAHLAGCRGYPECAAEGLCSPPPLEKRGDAFACVAAADADCARSAGCEASGKCRARDGVCLALAPDDCTRSRGCVEEGKCSPRDGACLVLSEADCRHATWCTRPGGCAVQGGKCVFTDEGCRGREDCVREGRCAAQGSYCVPGSDDDCARSTLCRASGACVLRFPGLCGVSDAGCRASDECRIRGTCSALLLPCGGKDDCFHWSTCVATRADDCQRSNDCQESGRCALGGEGTPQRCVTSEAGCRASNTCRDQGRCSAAGMFCQATTRADCQRSTLCRAEGRCALEAGDCWDPTGNEGTPEAARLPR